MPEIETQLTSKNIDHVVGEAFNLSRSLLNHISGSDMRKIIEKRQSSQSFEQMAGMLIYSALEDLSNKKKNKAIEVINKAEGLDLLTLSSQEDGLHLFIPVNGRFFNINLGENREINIDDIDHLKYLTSQASQFLKNIDSLTINTTKDTLITLVENHKFKSESAEFLKRREVVFVGTTQYRKFSLEGNNSDSVRGEIALDQLKKFREAGFQIVIIDTKSSKEFIFRLEDMGVKVFSEENLSLSGANRQGFEKASDLGGARYIIKTEVEKPWTVEDLDKLVEPLQEGKAEMVIPSRCPNPNSENQLIELCNYPPVQAHFEALGNLDMNKALKENNLLSPDINLDLYNGTRVFINKREIIDLMSKKLTTTKTGNWLYDELTTLNPNLEEDVNFGILQAYDRWFNALFAPVAALLANKYRVSSVEIPYRHPDEQTQLEIGNKGFDSKRIEQFFKIVGPFADYVKYLLRNKI